MTYSKPQTEAITQSQRGRVKSFWLGHNRKGQRQGWGGVVYHQRINAKDLQPRLGAPGVDNQTALVTAEIREHCSLLRSPGQHTSTIRKHPLQAKGKTGEDGERDLSFRGSLGHKQAQEGGLST